jgi:ribosomal protein S6--L-glutamate ligase/gamma-F420-2:alpha-L-glutamate ligase
MTGWVIYYRGDLVKNKRFIQFIKEGFAEHNIDIKVIVLEENDIHQKEMPDFVINRSRDWHVASFFEQKGVRVFNSRKVAEIANDKERTYSFLQDIVPFMPLLKRTEVEKRKNPYIIKSCSGHGGSQVFWVENNKQKEAAIKAMSGNSYIMQECCSDLGKDVRVYVIGNKIIQAMERTSTESFKSNYSLGGSARPYTLNAKEIKMVQQILNKLPLDYGGIDFIFHEGQAVFNEIEDAVGARMVYENTNIDIVKLFIEYIVKELTAEAV